MAHTSRGRVILGGLLAGLVINVVEYILNGLILGKTWEQALQALGKPASFSTAAIVIFNICGFLIGIAGVWLYAAIRPRYGMGSVTAIRAGIAVWVIGSLVPNLATYALHLFPTGLMATTTIVGLVEIIVGTWAGAWLYKEEKTETVPITRPTAA